MAQSEKHPITTHVLDQTTGLPAKNLRATLTLFNAQKELVGTWEARTSSTDGRISSWPREDPQLPQVLEALGAGGEPIVGNLLFHTGEYWGPGKTFYPEIVVTFVVDMKEERKHWHVPVLMGPFGYTTYRGS